MFKPNQFNPFSNNLKVPSVIKELLQSKPLQIKIKGTCMMPIIKNNERVTVNFAKFYLPGDIVLCTTENGKIVAHRLLGYYPTCNGWKAMTKGDANPRPDNGIPAKNILGHINAGQNSHQPFKISLIYRSSAFLYFLVFCCLIILKRLATAIEQFPFFHFSNYFSKH